MLPGGDRVPWESDAVLFDRDQIPKASPVGSSSIRGTCVFRLRECGTAIHGDIANPVGTACALSTTIGGGRGALAFFEGTAAHRE